MRTHQLEMADGGTCQDTERNGPSEAHSLSGDGRGRDLSGHRKKLAKRGTLTLWRRQREEHVRTQKETGQARHTHKLETVERNLSGHRKKQAKRGTLTNWRRQRDELVRTCKETEQASHTHILEMAEGGDLSEHRTQKEINRARRTHFLETAEGGTCQATERDQPTKADSPTGDSRERDLSGHGKKPMAQGALTSWRWQREGLVRTQKETDRPRHTHSLETVEGGTCQDPERDRPTEANSLSGDGRGRDLSGHRKKPTE